MLAPHNLLNFSTEAFQKGGRKGAKKVMIVITDGESHDSPDLEKVIEGSEKDNVTRYAVAVSLLLAPPTGSFDQNCSRVNLESGSGFHW